METTIFTAAVVPKEGPASWPTISIIGTKARSWARRMAMVSFATGCCRMPMSSSIFTTTAVLLSATTKPSSTERPSDQPNSVDSSSMTATLAATCMSVASTATRQMSRRPPRLSSMPTKNRSSSTPSSARTSICSRFWTRPRAEGPRMMPARM